MSWLLGGGGAGKRVAWVFGSLGLGDDVLRHMSGNDSYGRRGAPFPPSPILVKPWRISEYVCQETSQATALCVVCLRIIALLYPIRAMKSGV